VLLLNGNDSIESFAERLSLALGVLVPSDLAAVERFDRSAMWTDHLLRDSGGVIDKHFAAFLRLGATHPLFPAFLSGNMRSKPFRISDVMSRTRLRTLEIYDQFLKPVGVDTQIGVSVTFGNGSSDVLILSRKGTDFSERESQCLAAFLPHLASAMRHQNQLGQCDIRHKEQITELAARHCMLSRLRGKYNLTPRENEIMWWLTRAKCDRDIGEICDVSQRTVQKHCENIYRKLGVDGRTAAVVLALDMAG
jgi:DNA-binding CsgD family transcriptional regulator